MGRFRLSNWLPALASAVVLASSTYAQENRFQDRADILFGAPEQSLLRQIGHDDIGPPGDALACDEFPCDFIGEEPGSGYLFGGDRWSLRETLFGEESAYGIGGWVQAGYHNRSTGLFNDVPNRVNFHQVWLYLERVADGREGFDWGFRTDFMYGTDARHTQAFGNSLDSAGNPRGWDNRWNRGGGYGWAMPQLYGEVAYQDLSVIAGHFYTLLGYEVVTAPDNFFYSHALTMFNSEAFTHTGVLGTYSVSDNLEVYAGWTLGWDTGFDQFGGGNNFLGGFSLAVLDDVTLTYILTAGNLGWVGEGYTHSIVAELELTEKLSYVAQSDLVSTTFQGVGYNTIGVNQYLFYWLNDGLGLGGRAEWWKADGDSYYAITGGVNIKPAANFVIRPEVRYQWSPAQNRSPATALVPVNEGAIFGIDAILTF